MPAEDDFDASEAYAAFQAYDRDACGLVSQHDFYHRTHMWHMLMMASFVVMCEYGDGLAREQVDELLAILGVSVAAQRVPYELFIDRLQRFLAAAAATTTQQ